MADKAINKNTVHKVAVLVSGGGTNLQQLINAGQRGEMPHANLSLVVSSKPNVKALERAEKAGIENIVVERKKIKDEKEYSRALIEELQKRNIDAIVLAGFLSVLSEEFIKSYNNRIINIHPSLIPAFSGKGFYGLRVHEAALERGVKITGATAHMVNEICDGGKIIMQKAVEVKENDTPAALQKRVMEEAEWVLLPKALEMICACNFNI